MYTGRSKKHSMARVMMGGVGENLSEFAIKGWCMVVAVRSTGWPKLRWIGWIDLSEFAIKGWCMVVGVRSRGWPML